MNPKLEKYVPLVEFISQLIGKNCEVILHDCCDMEHSIVAISTNSLTGRQVGGTVTDFALSILSNKKYHQQQYLLNYPGRNNNKNFRSSTFFIKDEEQKIIGMLCINIDISALENTKKLIEEMIATQPLLGDDNEKVPESYVTSADDLLQDILRRTSNNYQVPVDRLNATEKRSFISMLSRQGFFLLKGGIAAAAAWLNVSEQSIYRYLKEL